MNSKYIILCSENTPSGYKVTRLKQILLNGNHICSVRILIILVDSWWKVRHFIE